MHRMQNLNEVSARYTELPDEFYIPKTWRKQDTTNKQGSQIVQDWNVPGFDLLGTDGVPTVRVNTSPNETWTGALQRACNQCYSVYRMLLENGVAREMARMVLPVNIYTEIYACWDMKNLLHFITLRDDSHAQAEIQEYGQAIKAICRKLFPGIIKAYEKYQWRVFEV